MHDIEDSGELCKSAVKFHASSMCCFEKIEFKMSLTLSLYGIKKLAETFNLGFLHMENLSFSFAHKK